MLIYGHTERENVMGTARKKAGDAAAASNYHRKFPDEAYEFDDDVTSDAVAEMRARAKDVIDAEKWSVIDGFGRVIHP